MELLLVDRADRLNSPVGRGILIVHEDKDSRTLFRDDAARRLPLAVALDGSETIWEAWRHLVREGSASTDYR